MLFRDRPSAGAALVPPLRRFANERDVIVLGLARGGVPVARPVADAIDAPLDICVARKIGVPGIEEVALGAIAEGIDDMVADTVAWYIGVPAEVLRKLSARERLEIARRGRLYRDGRAPINLKNRLVILVDDGLATGATLRAAVRAVRAQHPRRVVVAVPAGTSAGADALRPYVDELIVLRDMSSDQTVSMMYQNFDDVTDVEVLDLLDRPARVEPAWMIGTERERVSMVGALAAREPAPAERPLQIPVESGVLLADYAPPQVERSMGALDRVANCAGLAILLHGGGSSRNSYRNRYLAARLRLSGYASLRLDLLTEQEQEADASDASLRFNVWRTASRLVSVSKWARRQGLAGSSVTTLIGASTSAAAALWAAALLGDCVSAVITRGGRVDLAGDVVRQVQAPVLMIVGDDDRATITRSRQAQRLLPNARMVRIKGAGHSFEEAGALGALAETAVEWLAALRPERAAHQTA